MKNVNITKAKVKPAKSGTNATKPNMLKRILLTILTLLCITGLVYAAFKAWAQPSVKHAFAVATVRQPDNYTELYFTNHLTIPKRFSLHKITYFPFTIHNLTDKDTNYPYEVDLLIDGEKIVLDKNTVLVKKNDSKTIQESFTPTVRTPRVEIVVNLTSLNQQIDFWVEANP